MKNQYFGDVNDYLKYGLVRGLAQDDVKVLLAWMLTPEDGRSGGRFVEYLASVRDWRPFDPPLFDFLCSVVLSEGRRDVSAIESWPGLNATFFSSMVPDPRTERDRWSEHLLAATPDHDLVFFDPDNGIEISSTPKGRKDSSKFVLWDELCATWRAGASLLIYQHFPRRHRDSFLAQTSDELRSRLVATTVMALRKGRVAFFLVPQESHVETLRERAEAVAAHWYPHIRLELRAEN